MRLSSWTEASRSSNCKCCKTWHATAPSKVWSRKGSLDEMSRHVGAHFGSRFPFNTNRLWKERSADTIRVTKGASASVILPVPEPTSMVSPELIFFARRANNSRSRRSKSSPLVDRYHDSKPCAARSRLLRSDF